MNRLWIVNSFLFSWHSKFAIHPLSSVALYGPVVTSMEVRLRFGSRAVSVELGRITRLFIEDFSAKSANPLKHILPFYAIYILVRLSFFLEIACIRTLIQPLIYKERKLESPGKCLIVTGFIVNYFISKVISAYTLYTTLYVVIKFEKHCYCCPSPWNYLFCFLILKSWRCPRKRNSLSYNTLKKYLPFSNTNTSKR